MQPEPGATPAGRERTGRRPARILLGIVLAVIVVVVLFKVVFPWFQEYQDDPTLEGAPVPVVAAARP